MLFTSPAAFPGNWWWWLGGLEAGGPPYMYPWPCHPASGGECGWLACMPSWPSPCPRCPSTPPSPLCSWGAPCGPAPWPAHGPGGGGAGRPRRAFTAAAAAAAAWAAAAAAAGPALDWSALCDGDVWLGEDAVALGLADDLGTSDDLLRSLATRGCTVVALRPKAPPTGLLAALRGRVPGSPLVRSQGAKSGGEARVDSAARDRGGGAVWSRSPGSSALEALVDRAAQVLAGGLEGGLAGEVTGGSVTGAHWSEFDTGGPLF
mmetsp:Transcript_66985/g.151389  ORF Transcript_66985/g.151389 Transcript_66985/m.151389 type:complete len:262 (+) Transcript_66985:236-1021(+)